MSCVQAFATLSQIQTERRFQKATRHFSDTKPRHLHIRSLKAVRPPTMKRRYLLLRAKAGPLPALAVPIKKMRSRRSLAFITRERADHTLQRTRHERRGCNPPVPWAGSLYWSLGDFTLYGRHESKTGYRG